MKTIVITGASSGISRATALQLAGQGHNVVLAARNGDALKQVARQCVEAGGQALAVPTDVTDPNAVKKVMDAALKQFGSIDGWLNGASVYALGKIEDIPAKDYARIIEVNLMGYVYAIQLILPYFKQQKSGVLVNIGSINSTVPQPLGSAYVASKFAVKGMTDSIRSEVYAEGLRKQVHVCLVLPASFDTPLFQHGADYTGRNITALQPANDPVSAARDIAKLFEKPKREIHVGISAGTFLFQRQLAPAIYERIAPPIIDKLNLGEKKVADTSGNIYKSIPPYDITGGWRK